MLACAVLSERQHGSRHKLAQETAYNSCWFLYPIQQDRYPTTQFRQCKGKDDDFAVRTQLVSQKTDEERQSYGLKTITSPAHRTTGAPNNRYTDLSNYRHGQPLETSSRGCQYNEPNHAKQVGYLATRWWSTKHCSPHQMDDHGESRIQVWRSMRSAADPKSHNSWLEAQDGVQTLLKHGRNLSHKRTSACIQNQPNKQNGTQNRQTGGRQTQEMQEPLQKEA